jgi:phospholipid/cholesterol/gamma-HCH transport system substrate-binding protein
MNNRNSIETIIGALVLVVAIGFAFFAYESSNLKPVNGYSIKARFSSVDGLGSGSDVRIGGIKVGVVSAMDIDPKTYEALLTLQLRDNIKVPDDSNASVVSSGLLGSKFVELTPGGSEVMLKADDEIAFTQSSVNFETLIGKMVHSGGGVDEKPTSDDATATDADKAKDAGLPTLE